MIADLHAHYAMHLVERRESIWKLLRHGVPRESGRDFEASFGVIRAHVDRMAEITASHEHIAIGSDFDGFGELDAERMCSGNVPRVLQTGWGRRLAV
jgi:microsomal dipeptidase-like Zn-dependent dipeptidase